jgi:hypothetical protein
VLVFYFFLTYLAIAARTGVGEAFAVAVAGHFAFSSWVGFVMDVKFFFDYLLKVLETRQSSFN